MPIYKCASNGKYRIGNGSCIYTNKAQAEKVYRAILAQGEFAAKVVSFDFDDTLSTSKGQDKAKQMLAEGYRVLIITARQSKDSKAVFEVADKLGIKRSDIYFTNGKNKWETVKRLGVAIHYDNNQDQIDLINKMTKTEGKLFK
jgi:hypothetical protein